MKTPKLSIVMTAHNEAGIIEDVITSYYNEICKKIPCEILIAEDGSTDGTKEILLRMKKKMPMRLIMGDKKKGFKQACIDAYSAARTPWIFFTDSDGQYVPQDFWKLYRNMKNYDVIYGRKINRKDPFYRKFLAGGFNFIIRIMFKMPYHDLDSGFRLMRKEVVDDVIGEIKHLKYGFTAEFNIRTFYKGFNILEVPIRHKPRKYGGTSMFPILKLPSIVLGQIRDLFKLRKELLKD
ncbi:hypothetical protein CMO88_01060 [Candidatus Woesearchaeota archaeon]|nr:hypothetical protein [Candidatus Woesearchaeota archaeon]|tara:strand:- start:7808 stop:8518 length:711 start_codon:yes stop_codon:yes gene_type:complete